MPNSYYDILKQTKTSREAVNKRKTQLAANPLDFQAATWLHRYYRHEGNAAAAGNTLLGFCRQKERAPTPWNAAELLTIARDLEGVDMDEAARHYYALYNLPGDPANAEQALAGLAAMLLKTPDSRMHFGSGDLTFYRDIASADSGPGFLNGVLSLILNSSEPAVH